MSATYTTSLINSHKHVQFKRSGMIINLFVIIEIHRLITIVIKRLYRTLLIGKPNVKSLTVLLIDPVPWCVFRFSVLAV